MRPTPTGRIERRDDQSVLVLTRTFRAPIEDVWASITDPQRLDRWIGTYTGDPASGKVIFSMTAEGDAPPEEVTIRECVPPYALRVTTHVGDDSWMLDLELTEADGVTTLTFSQPGIDPAAAENVGPGWEYYLDRLVTVETGGDAAVINWDDYYPAMQDHYSVT